MGRKTSWTKEQFIKAVEESTTVASVLRKIGLQARPGNCSTVHKYLKEFGLDTSHWCGQAHLKGKEHNHKNKIPLKDILIKDSTYTNTYSLKKRLIRKGILEYKCYECEIDSWNNKYISLQIEHINGNKYDNRIENLTLLCPNCHSQTDTFCRKKIKHTPL